MAQNPVKNVPFNAADAMYADTVPFYPSRKYVDKGLAPEKFPKESVRAAAKAAREAVDAGVISPSLAMYILPNILTEGRPDDFGVRGGNKWDKGENAPIGQIVKKLGIKGAIVDADVSVEDIASLIGAHANIAGIGRNIPMYKKGDVAIVPKSGNNPAELAYNAKLMTAILAEKARIAKGDDLEAIRRWNGAAAGGAENHVRKVVEASDLLVNEPKNAEIMKLFKEEFLKEPKKPDVNEGKM
jgi:hypothetical protein